MKRVSNPHHYFLTAPPSGCFPHNQPDRYDGFFLLYLLILYHLQDSIRCMKGQFLCILGNCGYLGACELGQGNVVESTTFTWPGTLI